MNKTSRTLFFVALIAILVVVSGCNLQASKAPATKATPTSELNFITPTAGQGLQGDILTQTAAVAPAVATATPVPATATAAPASGGTGGASEATATPKPASASSSSQSIPTLARPTTYAIQKGEFPWCIARRFDIDVSKLLALNPGPYGVGYVLKIPASGNWNSANGDRHLHDHVNYTVKSTDSVYTIACYFGDVSPEGILAANNLSSAADVKTGMTLKIP